MIENLAGLVCAGENLSQQQMHTAVDAMMRGDCSEAEIASLLTGLTAKGETVEEVAGAAAAMREHMTPIRSDREGLIDTCGTGGDGSGTFNISTAAAIVTAAAGVPVAKHGNRRITSKSGSADVLAKLGVNIEATVDQVERSLDDLGICFCFAPLLHQAMKHVGPVRRKLGVPTIFNMLGPLCHPARAPFQLLGGGKPELRPLMAQALGLLGTRHAAVVCGEDGLDEVTLDGPTRVTEIRDGKLTELTWTPEDFGLASCGKETMLASGPDESAALIRRIIEGEKGPPRDIVVLNAAAAIWTAGASSSLSECAERAAAAIDDGRTSRLLADLAKVSHA